jgi:localization factor PodJL
LLERLEAASSDPRPGNLGRVEDGLQDILRHLANQQASFAALAETRRSAPEPQDSDLLLGIMRHLENQQASFAALAETRGSAQGPQDNGLIDVVKRELSEIRFGQTETNRHTQDSLEAVHNTLGHVVDRLAMIEGDLREVRTIPVAPPPVAPQPVAPPVAAPIPPQPAAPRFTMPAQPRPELPNPAAAEPHFASAPRDFHAAEPPAITLTPPQAISEILQPPTALSRIVIEPDLPPDHPLEPGTRPTARVASPSERIAASESAISEIPATGHAQNSSSSFIAAARRAAQAAAAAQPPTDKAGRKAGKRPRTDRRKHRPSPPRSARCWLARAWS